MEDQEKLLITILFKIPNLDTDKTSFNKFAKRLIKIVAYKIRVNILGRIQNVEDKQSKDHSIFTETLTNSQTRKRNALVRSMKNSKLGIAKNEDSFSNGLEFYGLSVNHENCFDSIEEIEDRIKIRRISVLFRS